MDKSAIGDLIPPIYIPRRWYNLLKRLAEFEPGKVYIVTVIMPKQADGEPGYVVTDGGKVENWR
jgi:hypothetical protein